LRARTIDLVRSGRSLHGLSRKLGVTETTIHSWVRQGDLDSGRRNHGLTTEERQELTQLRRETVTAPSTTPAAAIMNARADARMMMRAGFLSPRQ
jgi:transposase-like protein